MAAHRVAIRVAFSELPFPGAWGFVTNALADGSARPIFIFFAQASLRVGFDVDFYGLGFFPPGVSAERGFGQACHAPFERK
jgi:hypothetical protein